MSVAFQSDLSPIIEVERDFLTRVGYMLCNVPSLVDEIQKPLYSLVDLDDIKREVKLGCTRIDRVVAARLEELSASSGRIVQGDEMERSVLSKLNIFVSEISENLRMVHKDDVAGEKILKKINSVQDMIKRRFNTFQAALETLIPRPQSELPPIQSFMVSRHPLQLVVDNTNSFTIEGHAVPPLKQSERMLPEQASVAALPCFIESLATQITRQNNMMGECNTLIAKQAIQPVAIAAPAAPAAPADVQASVAAPQEMTIPPLSKRSWLKEHAWQMGVGFVAGRLPVLLHFKLASAAVTATSSAVAAGTAALPIAIAIASGASAALAVHMYKMHKAGGIRAGLRQEGWQKFTRNLAVSATLGGAFGELGNYVFGLEAVQSAWHNAQNYVCDHVASLFSSSAAFVAAPPVGIDGSSIPNLQSMSVVDTVVRNAEGWTPHDLTAPQITVPAPQPALNPQEKLASLVLQMQGRTGFGIEQIQATAAKFSPNHAVQIATDLSTQLYRGHGAGRAMASNVADLAIAIAKENGTIARQALADSAFYHANGFGGAVKNMCQAIKEAALAGHAGGDYAAKLHAWLPKIHFNPAQCRL